MSSNTVRGPKARRHGALIDSDAILDCIKTFLNSSQATQRLSDGFLIFKTVCLIQPIKIIRSYFTKLGIWNWDPLLSSKNAPFHHWGSCNNIFWCIGLVVMSGDFLWDPKDRTWQPNVCVFSGHKPSLALHKIWHRWSSDKSSWKLSDRFYYYSIFSFVNWHETCCECLQHALEIMTSSFYGNFGLLGCLAPSLLLAAIQYLNNCFGIYFLTIWTSPFTLFQHVRKYYSFMNQYKQCWSKARAGLWGDTSNLMCEWWFTVQRSQVSRQKKRTCLMNIYLLPLPPLLSDIFFRGANTPPPASHPCCLQPHMTVCT